MAVRREKNYVMRRLNTPKRVTSPNGRTFVARYKRVSRLELPAHIRLGRAYRGRPARVPRRGGQRGAGLISSLKNFLKRPLVKSLVKTGVNHLPSLYNSATNRIKNEKVRKALQSEIAQEAMSKIVKKYDGK